MASPKADLKEHAEVHATCRLVPVMMQTGMTGSGFVPIDSRPATSASRASFPGFNEDAHRAQRQDRDKLRRTWVTDFAASSETARLANLTGCPDDDRGRAADSPLASLKRFPECITMQGA